MTDKHRLGLTGRTPLSEKVLSFVLGKGRLNRGDALAGYLFSLPWLFGFLMLIIGPFIVSAVMSFYSVARFRAGPLGGMAQL